VGIPGWRDFAPVLVATDLTARSDVGTRTRSLVRAAQDGDEESFGRIFDELHLPVYRYLAARLETSVDAEDLTAETFVAAFENIGRFRWQGPPFEAWVFKIARSKLVDHHRRVQRQPTSRIDGAVEARLASSGDPARLALWDEEKAQLLAHVRKLSPNQQEVIALRFFAGLSVSEVAHIMGRTDTSVRQLQFRAVNTLRRRMEWLR
jgi:RNA polymerase sigma-70 factor (ECF subfamily)